ncbi:TPA: hypothetical protein JAN90_02055 [Legionella pneumophila]|uniref:hypothetical protein n=1 Tax=Legionella sp. PATHC039 TaxID=2992042 RepID=UPI0007784F2B|nr:MULTISPECIES: hypothetical protein [Legionella]HAT8857569.1 hypothetical protein [Legionella pneumophila subsp. pneumophila]MCW8394218.1 hypothetical protein [Legionella sp. PATHC039]HAT7071577.1 hypothetical protein [Legionella pneumophila]HAT8641755.1 hypothetical protein [Legionella pneumophila]HAT8866761.1 hypothetical protein [Legionella pneumophila subsp. pneumophila]
MRIKIILCGLILTNLTYAQGCIVGGQASQPRYVCFDGRTLDLTEAGLVWNAKRGCFISSVPCCNYNATHYAYHPNPAKIGGAYARCRHDYPFTLGQMQTH